MKYPQKLFKGSLFALACALCACGSDDSNSQNPSTPENGGNDSTESSASVEPSSAGSPSNEYSSAESSAPQALILSFEEEMARDSLFVQASADTGFSTIESVYQNLASDERVVFLIRHAKRITKTSKEATLVYAGKVQAQQVGAKLASDESFAYGHTDFVRTQETAENIALGRGEEFPGSIVMPELTENWYIKDAERLAVYDTINDPSFIYSKWAYNNEYSDAFNDLKERCVRAITEVILPNISQTKRVNIFVSHDMFIGPLTVYCTNKKINRLRYWETDMWVYFVSGIAIVIKPNGERRYIPIDGIEYGT